MLRRLRRVATLRSILLAAIFIGVGPSLLPSAGAEPTADSYELVLIEEFQTPIYLTAPPEDGGRLFVVERGGRIVVVRDGVKLATPFLDLSADVSTGGERGLFSIAFAPDYPVSRRFYVVYSDQDGDVRVEEFQRSLSGADRADPATRRLVLTIEHSSSQFHYGGQLQFGTDGLLYVSVGDGGSSANAQRLGTLLGKLLRIDPRPSGGNPYSIPADNPFVAVTGARPEIYAYGLRNPWRFSFDRNTGDLVLGDVGQGVREEVDFTLAGSGGANFGWNCWEGTLKSSACEAPGHVEPVLEYGHDRGCSITGGYVVRDRSLGSLYGRYLFADYCEDDLRSTALAQPRASPYEPVGLALNSVASFGEDACGRIYALSLGSGQVYRLQQSGSPSSCASLTPSTLSIDDVTVVEGDAGTTNATFAVTLSEARTTSVSVDFATADGTALAPADYANRTGTLTFAAGERSKTVTVAVAGDTNVEPSETFFVGLTNPVGAAIGDGQGRGTIVDDDLPSLAVGDVTIAEGDTGTTSAEFRVSLSAASAGQVKVAYASADGSARAPADYTAASGALAFAPGERQKTVAVPVVGDTEVEADEAFFLSLSNAEGTTIADGQGRATIVDNEHPNTAPVAVDDAATTAEDNAVTVNVLANDSDPDGDPLTVTSETEGANGAVACTVAGVCTYEPNVNFNGADAFTYTLSDSRSGSATAAVRVTVTSVNDPPHPHDDFVETGQDTPVTFDVLANEIGHDDDGDTLAVTSPAPEAGHGSVSCTAAGSCTYAPATSFIGKDSFVYSVTDGHGGNSSATVFVTVLAVRSYRQEVLADGPGAYYRFGEVSGLLVGDEAGANPGVFVNGVGLGLPGALAGDGNLAASFDGVDDYVLVGDSGSLDATAGVTVEAWVKRSRSGVWQVVVGKPGNGQSRYENYSLWINTLDRPVAYFGDGVGYVRVESPLVLDTRWHHVAASYENATARMYVDGVLRASAASSVRLTANALPLNVGRGNSDLNYFGGLLDEVAVYGSALPAERIQAHYETARTG